MSELFATTFVQGMELENRFMRGATWENLATAEGYLTDDLLEIYRELAAGGVGAIITGYAFVMENEQPNPGMMGIYDDSFIEEYQKLTEAIHNQGSNAILQIAYGGSQTHYPPEGREIWGPSAVENQATGVTPTRMTKENIQQLVNSFAEAGLRAKKAGFDGVEIHGAHGYLLSQFLTPYYNRREDEYGGSIENRARIIYEVYEAIREKVGLDYPVLIKLNCADFIEQGLEFADSKKVAQELAQRGIDGIEISGGCESSPREQGTIRSGIDAPDKEAYFQDYAAQIAEEVDVPVILIGGNRSLDVMEDVLKTTEIDYFSLARPLIREPDLINKFQSGEQEEAKCISCNKCFTQEGHRCIFN
ncbi:NADH:flavin oxidoreductase [Halanaerobaculum tunisiense]